MRDNWLRKLNEAPPICGEKLISMPALWVPGRTCEEHMLGASARSILRELSQQKKCLQDLSWRDLEEIVAEMLRDLGLKVTVTKRSRDGGRDVIARGELIPGEPAVMAVEVKHMPVVPIRELRSALWANRHFPALLFATSGRFSAGVFREKIKDEAALRLYLKDGVALQQWLNLYAAKRQWKGIRSCKL
jgi:restriction system protein